MSDTAHRRPTPTGIPTETYHVRGHKWTFADSTVRTWVQERLKGTVLNVCAGQTRLDYGGQIITNDTNPDIDTDHSLKVRQLPDELGADVADTVIYDPPWSVFQSNEEYGGRMVGKDRIMAEAINELVRDGGRVLGFGYQSTIMPADLGFTCREIAVFRQVGRLKDFFGVVDERRDKQLSQFGNTMNTEDSE